MTLCSKTRNRIFVLLLLSSCISSFVYTALNTALTPIMQQLQVSAGTVQWLASSYSLVMGIMVLATPFLIRRFPSNPLYIVSMGLFCLGLLMSAVADSFLLLLAGRVLQAVGCGVLSSLTQVVILAVFPVHQRGSLMGVYGLAITALPVLAPTVAGVIIDFFSWQMIFGGTLVISLAVLAGGVLWMQNFAPQEKLRFDTLSMCLCSGGFLGIVVGLGNWGGHTFVSLQAWLPILLGLAALAAFTLRQLRMEVPFLNVSIFSDTNFRTAVLASMLLYSGAMAVSTLIPLYMQSLRGYSAVISGLVTMPGALCTAVFSVISGKLYDRMGIRKLFLAGTLFLTVGSAAFCFVSDSTSPGMVAALFTIRSVGLGSLLMTSVTWGMSTLPNQYVADGTAILSSLRTIAGAVGAVVFVAMMTAVAGSTDTAAMLTGMRASFGGITVVSVVIALLAVCKVGVRPPDEPYPLTAKETGCAGG